MLWIKNVFNKLVATVQALLGYSDFDFADLDIHDQEKFIEYIKDNRSISYELNKKSIDYLNNVQLKSSKITTNLLEIVYRLSKLPKSDSDMSSGSSSYKNRVLFAVFDLIKDFEDDENKNDNEFTYFEPTKIKKSYNKNLVDRDEFMVSFGDDKYNKDMMSVSKKLLQLLPTYHHDIITISMVISMIFMLLVK